MLNISRTVMVGFVLMFSFNANADWFGGNDCPPWVYDCNDWPEWTPMYWMEEMSDEFDDNDDDYYRYGGAPYGGPAPFGPPMGAPMPYGGPMGAPMPYGGPMGRPMGPAPMPYGRPPMMPPMPYGAPPRGPAPAPAK